MFRLFVIFLKIGAISFGGGYAMLPIIYREVCEKGNFLSDDEFMDILSISQMTPGPIAVNMATFLGIRISILAGALATIGVVLAPFFYMSFVNIFLVKYGESKKVRNTLTLLRPVTSALILFSFFLTFKKTVVDVKMLVGFFISFLILKYTKIHPIIVIFTFGFIGILVGLI